MKKIVWCMGVALLCATVLGACKNKKANGDADLDDEDDTELVEQDEEQDEDDLELTEQDNVSDPYDVNTLIAEEGEVWTHFGGTYTFASDGVNAIVDVDLDDCQNEREILRCVVYIGDEEFDGTIDTHTGCITCNDDSQGEVFRAYMFNGGNLLRGWLHGKPVSYEGLCGM